MTARVAPPSPVARRLTRRLAGSLGVVCLAGLLAPLEAGADWHIVPSLSVMFGGDTNIVDLNLGGTVEKRHDAFGVSVGLIGDGWMGVEGDLAFAPSFFGGDSVGGLTTSSRLTTVMGNFVVLVPRRIVGDSLRPYAVGGLGLVRARVDYFGGLAVDRNLLGFSVGGGVTGFLTDRAGVRWDLRYFKGTSGDETLAVTGGTGRASLSFWRLSMGVVLRY